MTETLFYFLYYEAAQNQMELRTILVTEQLQLVDWNILAESVIKIQWQENRKEKCWTVSYLSWSTHNISYKTLFKQKIKLLKNLKNLSIGYSRSVPNVNDDEDSNEQVANPGSSTLPKRTSSERSNLPTYKQALIASRFSYPRSRRSSYSFSEDR